MKLSRCFFILLIVVAFIPYVLGDSDVSFPGSWSAAYDADADGLPDAWENEMIGNTNQDALGNTDGDSCPNGFEYFLGKDPKTSDCTQTEKDTHKDTNNNGIPDLIEGEGGDTQATFQQCSYAAALANAEITEGTGSWVMNFDYILVDGANKLDWYGETISNNVCPDFLSFAYGLDKTRSFIPDLSVGPPFFELSEGSRNDSDGTPLCPSAASKEGKYFLIAASEEQLVIGEEKPKATGRQIYPEPPAKPVSEWNKSDYLYDVNWDENEGDCLCLLSTKTKEEVWDIGGEAIETDSLSEDYPDNCCGDDNGEFPINSRLDTFTFDFSSCCGPDVEGGTESNKCAFDEVCYPGWEAGDSVMEDNKIFIDQLYVCKENEWLSADDNSDLCGSLGAGRYMGDAALDDGICCGAGDSIVRNGGFESSLVGWEKTAEGVDLTETEGLVGEKAVLVNPKGTDGGIRQKIYLDLGEKYIYFRIKAKDDIKVNVLFRKEGRTRLLASFSEDLKKDDVWRARGIVIETLDYDQLNRGQGFYDLIITPDSGTTSAFIVDDVRIYNKNDYDQGYMEEDQKEVCVDCSFRNCPTVTQETGWNVIPSSRSYLIYTIDNLRIGEGSYDLVSDGNKWLYCNADGEFDGWDAVGEFQTFQGDIGGQVLDTCSRDGAIGCSCPFDDSGDIDIMICSDIRTFEPGHFEQCGCTKDKNFISKNLCDSNEVNCADSNADGTCDDCIHIGADNPQGCITHTDRSSCEASSCEWRNNVCVFVNDMTGSKGNQKDYLKSSCSNLNYFGCMEEYKPDEDDDILDFTQFSCEEVTGSDNFCSSGQECIGGSFIETTEQRAGGGTFVDTTCCRGGVCGDPKTMECEADLGGYLCDSGAALMCVGDTIVSKESSTPGSTETCCDSELNCVPDKEQVWNSFGQIDDGRSFLCYEENGVNRWAECCFGTDCYNGYRQDFVLSSDKNVFGTGSMIYALGTFDSYAGQKLYDYVRIFTLERGGSAKTESYIARGKGDWSEFSHLEFDLIYNYYPGKLELRDANGAVISKLDDVLHYSNNGDGINFWHHFIIPLGEFEDSNGEKIDFSEQLIDGIHIYGKTGSSIMQIGLDNFFLSKRGSAYRNHYCAGPYKRWITELEPPLKDGAKVPYGLDDVDPGIEDIGEDRVSASEANSNDLEVYREVCDSQASYTWTGTQCCGDDNLYSPYYAASTLGAREYYTDRLAACFQGYPLFNNQRMNDSIPDISTYKRIMYIQPDLRGCNYEYDSETSTSSRYAGFEVDEDGVKIAGGTLKIIKEDYCRVAGDFFCSHDNDYWKEKNTNENEDLLPKSRDTERNAVNLRDFATPEQLPATYEDGIREKGCCPSDMCWNGELCVKSIDPTDVIDSTFVGDNPESFSSDFGADKLWACMHQPEIDIDPDDDIIDAEEDAYWKQFDLKERWDNYTSGYCETEQCWTGGECVNESWFTEEDSKEIFGYANPNVGDEINYGSVNKPITQTIGDRYCEGEKGWTSRTKLVALALVNHADSAVEAAQDYTIFCDTYDNVLNNYPQLDDYMGAAGTGNNVESVKSNNFCVLSYDNPDYNVWFGTSLNTEINIGHDQLLGVLGADYSDNCMGVGKDDGNFHDCGTEKKLYYNDKYNLVVFTEHAKIFQPGFIDNFIENPIRTIIDALIGLVTDQEESKKKAAEAIGQIKDFSGYYAAVLEGTSKITGTKETVFEKIDSEKNEIHPIKTMNVLYNDYTDEICGAIGTDKGLHCSSETDDDDLVQVYVFQKEDMTRPGVESKIDIFWNYLTAETRPE